MKEEKGEKINVLSSHVNKVKCKGARQSRKRRSLDRQTWLTIVKDGRVIRRVRRCQTNALTSRRSRDDPKGWIETILFTLSLVQRCRQHNADIYKKKFYPPGFFLFLSFFLSFVWFFSARDSVNDHSDLRSSLPFHFFLTFLFSSQQRERNSPPSCFFAREFLSRCFWTIACEIHAWIKLIPTMDISASFKESISFQHRVFHRRIVETWSFQVFHGSIGKAKLN